MSVIKVLVVFGNIPLLGQERGNIQVFTSLKEVGVEACFMTHREYGYLSIQPELDKQGLSWEKGTFPGLFSTAMSLRTWCTRVREVLQSNRDFKRIFKAYRPTHIHIGNEGHFINLLPALWFVRTPVIFRLGDAPRSHRFIFRLIWKWFIIPRVNRFVCISRFIEGLLLDAGASKDNISVIYNFPPDRPGIDPVEEDLPAPFEGHTVFYMGQINQEKGVGLLIEAAITICLERKDVRFLIAGDYSWKNEFAKELMGQIEKCGLSQRIEFLGYIHAIPEILRQSTLHVCPSISEEPLGNVVVEAKKAGIPSVIFKSGGLPELITHLQDGYICTNKTIDALAEGINYFLDLEADVLRTMGEQACQSLYRLQITRAQFTAAWQLVYEQIP